MSTLSVFVVILNVILALLFSLGLAPILVWVERRVAGLIQDRLGPNRCHINGIRLGGLVQSLADMLKLVFKEDFQAKAIQENFFFSLAPVIVFVSAFLSFMVMPFADDLIINGERFIMQGLPTDLGILWFLALAGLSVYGIMLGGWASRSKYSLLGAMRAGAQVISYEAAMGLSVVSLLITYGSIHLGDIVAYQGELLLGFIPAWGIVVQPLAALIFIVTAFAEANRTPFDLAEGESEIVGGYHTEYSAMRFGLFFVGEYVAMSASSALIVTLFLGGYHLPYLNTQTLQTTMPYVLGFIILALPLGSFYAMRWIKKHNRWYLKSDVRNTESAVLQKGLIGFNVLVIAGLGALLYLGLTPTSTNVVTAVIQISTFAVKLLFMNFVFVWVRWTLPRFRYDQLQTLGWKVLMPLAIANIVVSAIIIVVKEL
ncbi:complex I subunit 1/NuoH family protein [Sulfurospirillum multivorans]|uniref:NADH-quinone oxidoreductase subunit H n=2 Tax=Sulfurospirillum multivorans TaxID=66821 RepID=A0AA86AJP2_SULMK|nr:complex I subunit 1 family protein [Sulfurospirillum multivorans]AHJ11784.1 NADH-ubiquinone oxidoreductase chain H [Sulfurospirillum multivorans DSM 12446]QEH05290.1 NADH-ubiquinone oxidoreductase chain H [Sulfurospirillum multivorans]